MEIMKHEESNRNKWKNCNNWSEWPFVGSHMQNFLWPKTEDIRTGQRTEFVVNAGEGMHVGLIIWIEVTERKDVYCPMR